MENVDLKTIEELNERFVNGNRVEEPEKIPVTYDGEALVTSLKENKAEHAEKAAFTYSDLFYELPCKPDGFSAFVKKVTRKIHHAKKF